MKTSELYESVAANIIADLEKGVATWCKPWKTNGGGIMPRNHASKRNYSGINIVILWDSQQKNGYPTSDWLTYKQAREIGGQVRGGEKSTRVVYTNTMLVGEGDEERKVGYLKSFNVFNVAQIDGLTTATSEVDNRELTPELRDSQALTFIKATKADIRHGGDRAFYRSADDFIMLPNVEAFESFEHYLATCYHEMAHWTGHEKRLDRKLANRFGSKEYAAEELIAEFGAAFLCAHLGVQGQLRHAEYLNSWVSLLKDDPRAILTACSQASRAAEHLRSYSEHVAEAA